MHVMGQDDISSKDDLGRPSWIYHPDPWHAPVAATTVFSTPDDGRRKRPKHVE